MATTTTLEKVSVTDLLKRIKNLKNKSEYTEKQLHRMKMELYATVYTYVESAIVQGKHNQVPEACNKLADDIKTAYPTTRAWYRYGKFIRDHAIDQEQALPSSLSNLARACFYNMTKRQQKKAIELLQEGHGPSTIKTYLRKTGRFYDDDDVKRVSALRRQYPTVKSWEEPLERLRADIQRSRKDDKLVQLSVFIDGEEAFFVG